MKRMGANNICRLLVLALAAVMLMTCTAYADEVSSMQQLQNRINANDQNIVLTGDISVTQTLNIGSGRNITIDLNGHDLTRTGNVGTIFSLSNGGRLTITDSETVNPSSKVVGNPARDPEPGRNGRDASDGTGIAQPTKLTNSGILTYYKSVSTVNADGITTTETRNEFTVDVGAMGGVNSSNNSNAALFNVSGGSALTIAGGAFSNPNGRIIETSGRVTLNLTGGYFYGSTAGNGSGGAVYINGYGNNRATVTIGGASDREVVFAGNSAANGGALATEGECDLTILNGAVFTGNKATGQGRNGGGAIYIGYNTNAVMEGGLVTNNWGTADVVGTADSSSYDAGGGGILLRGTLLMKGGQVTHNEAAGGGGISTVFWDGGVFSMTGGIVAGNVARLNEGGGITININGSGSITKGHITNNATETNQHWGGGGVFAADGGSLRMLAVVITQNTAGGFGGGLAGCSTGRIDTHSGNPDNSVNIEDHSIALYDNSAAGTHLSGDESTKSEDRIYAANDPVFMRDGDYFQDYFCALNTTVCSGMLGGGDAMWTGTVDGRAITPADVGKNERITSQYITGLTGDPSDADINKGIAKGLVFVTGNSSGTHGGGILCNGYLVIGLQNKIEIGDRMTIKGDKTVSGGTVTDEFTFIVTDANGSQITTGTSQGDSEIVFAGRIPFDDAGTYTFWIYEADDNIPQDLKMDTTRYRMVVTVTEARETTTVPNKDDPTESETIDVYFNKISSVQIYRHADANDTNGVRVANYTNISSENRNAYDLPFTFEFVNRVSKDTGIVVSKTVHDLSGSSSNAEFSFTVTLSDTTINGTKGGMTFTNGVATFTLKAGESIRAIELPANISYTVVETPADGYHNSNPNRTGTTTQDVVQSVVFENTAVGSLKIKKTVADNGATDFDRQRLFAFTIRLINGSNINGPHGNVVFANGVARVELRHGEEIVIPNLPAGMAYEVVEETTDGFDQNETTQNGTIAVGGTSLADFVNTRKTGELHIKKTVIDNNYKGEKFEFAIELINAPHINGKYGDVTFTNGEAKIELGHEETAKITGLPTGIGYTVDEVFSDVYSRQYAVGVVGNSSGTIGDTPSIVEYTNEKFAGLEIRKDVSGTVIDRAKEFKFELTLKNDTATLDNTYGGLTFTNGVATFTLKDGEYLIINGLPDGTTYTVKELDVDTDLYDVQINDQPAKDMGYTISGTLNSGDNEAADFHNFRRVGELTLSKTTDSPVTRDSERTFEFTVTLSEPINARLGDFQFVNGVDHVYLKNGQTMTATNIPAGITYTIVETPDADFDSSVSAGKASDTIVADRTSSVAFHNERRLGDLTITKVVEDDAATASDVFGFKITLDREINGTFGDVTFTDGVGTFTLKNDETVTITGLPEHTNYTIIETTFDALKYRPIVGTIYGDIDYNDTMEEEFHNEVLGGLVVTKTVDGVGADQTQEFTFTVTLDDTTINGTYGGMTFVDGVATFTLKHGERMTATHLPDDITYTVAEIANTAYKTTTPANASGTITAHHVEQVDFVNTFITGDLEVKKTLAGDAVNPADEFTFTVTLTDNTITGTYGDMTFNGGVATFTLRGGKNAVATDLPAGMGYTVEEASSAYTVTVPTNAQGTVAADTATTVEFINSLFIQYGGLSVQKLVNDTDVPADHEFQFTVTLGDTSINGVYGDMTFTGGVATFTLKAGETKIASNLPEGTAYTVTESTDALYDQVSATDASGRIVKNALVSAVYTNAHKRGDLTVTKTISGDGANTADKFAFTVTLSDASINGVYGGMTFADGVANFQLGHQESATATGLPAGLSYEVAEVTNGYTMTSTGETGVIAANATATAEFINTKMMDRGNLTVTKTITGDGANMAEKFAFTVTLNDVSINGVFGGMTFANGVANFQLGHQESVTATGLPAGLSYEVTEVTNDYTMTSTGETGVIAANATATAEFVNTKMMDRGNLTVTKTITGDGANMADKFDFTVTLSDSSINGTYGDMTFTDGVATFQLGHQESVTAAGLPAGIRYDVSEASKDYTATSTGETGTITANANATAEFVNTKMLGRGGLTVTKTITGDGADKTDKFTFTVKLSDVSIDGVFGDMTFMNGVATFQLGHQQRATADGLPAGIRYEVTEASKDYTATSTGETGTIAANSNAVVEFVNTRMRERGDLTVTKTITGDGADMDAKFTFSVTLDDHSINGVYGDMTFANGVATFKLGHAQSATAKQLPAGIAYKVEELDSADYKVTATNASGVISGKQEVSVTFVNNRDELIVPQTGDNTSMTLYAALLVMSAGILLLLKRKSSKA